MIQRAIFYFLLFFATITAQPAVAEKSKTTDSTLDHSEPLPNSDDAKTGFISQGTLIWADEKQKKWSNDVVNIGSYIDGYMGDTETMQDTNQSYLKVTFDFDVSKNDSVDVKPKFRFSLDLPITKKKFRLVVENDPDEGQSIEERNTSQLPSTNSSQSDDLYASFRYLIDSNSWDRLTWDWGVKARWPPDPFTRARGVRRWDLSDYWNMIFSQEIFWYESKGLGTYTQFDFDRIFLSSEDFLLRITNALDWREREERFSLFEQVSLFQEIDDKRAAQYAIGFSGENRKNHSVITNYFTKITYRRRLYKDWFFYELTPGVEFPREENFKVNPFIALRLEMLFSEDASRKLTTKLY